MKPARIYLDSNATTPVCLAAQEAALQAMSVTFGNPSSPHSEGVRARHLLERARAAAAQAIGAGDGHVVFMSGATEAIHTAVFSALQQLRRTRDAGGDLAHRLVVGATEHKAVLQSVRHWNAVLDLHLQVCELPVASDGRHDLVTLRHWLDDTALLCTMAANNETGVITDLATIETLLRDTASPALWLVDCVQALGKLPLALGNSRIDYATFSGHKLYAPKGIGLLFAARRAPLEALIVGGGQEGDWRSGTENLPGIAALGAVCEALVRGDLLVPHDALQSHRAALVIALRAAFDGLVFNAPLHHCLPTTLNFSVPGAQLKALLNLFDAAGLQVSAGSACSSGKASSSHVLQAMAVAPWAAASAIRLSFGPLDSADTIKAACTAIRHCGQIWRSFPLKSAQAPAELIAQEAPLPPDLDLSWEALEPFLLLYPHARLLDVREPHEVAAGALATMGERTAEHVPLSALAKWCTQLGAQLDTPIVLVCRSGNRSAQAARHLVASGARLVRHLPGGLALQA
jgi:cysteine sulfinate desulfinase/cysteine desulfurase-like protein/rhodanese-related sulfurtransferase